MNAPSRDAHTVLAFMSRREESILRYIARELEHSPRFDTTRLKRFSIETAILAREMGWKVGSKPDLGRARRALEDLRATGRAVVVHHETSPFVRTYYVTGEFVSDIARLKGLDAGRPSDRPARSA